MHHNNMFVDNFMTRGLREDQVLTLIGAAVDLFDLEAKVIGALDMGPGLQASDKVLLHKLFVRMRSGTRGFHDVNVIRAELGAPPFELY